MPTVLAAVAHPDDIEFFSSGTLALLAQAGCEIHMWNLADGSCGTTTLGREEIIRIRGGEAAESAAVIGARIHEPLFPDMEVFYDRDSLRRVSAVVREIRPQIVLTHPVSDYMEDHQNVCRLITSAVFGRAMPNLETEPSRAPYSDDVCLYHAPPHGLPDLRSFAPDHLVDVTSVIETKRVMLACHKSQFAWLEDSQGMDTPISAMERMGRAMASLGQGLEYAECWKRHPHTGFGPADFDPLRESLSSYLKPTT